MTDAEIVALYHSRSEQAIAHSKTQYGAYCRSLILRILGNLEDTDECMNDLWLRAWESIPPNRPRNLKLYFAKIGRNLACNRLRDRSAQKRGGECTDAVLEELAQCLPPGPSAEEQVAARELGDAISRFLRGLPRREGDVFIRRYFHAEPLEDIARRYGMRVNTLSVMLHRTRSKLRRFLEQEGYQ